MCRGFGLEVVVSVEQAPHSGRLRTQLGTRIHGVDSEVVIRRGDLSLTGAYLELDPPVEVGALGSMQALQLVPPNGSEPLELMARIVRIRGEQRLYGLPLLDAIAFEFLLENDAQRAELSALIRSCIDAQVAVADDLEIELHSPSQSSSTTLETIGMFRMTLRAQHAIELGETVSAEVEAPRSGRRVELAGAVESCRPRVNGDYEVVVNLKQDLLATLDSLRVSDLIDELIIPKPSTRRPPPQHLRGSLERIKLTSLLNLFAMDRFSGVLTLSGGARAREERMLYFDAGMIVDALGPEPSAIDVVHRASQIERGEFVFKQGPVERENRLGMSTTGLMLELARRDDEAAHSASKTHAGPPPLHAAMD